MPLPLPLPLPPLPLPPLPLPPLPLPLPLQRVAFEKLSEGQKVGEVELTVDDLFDLPAAEGAPACRLRVLIRRQRRGLPVSDARPPSLTRCRHRGLPEH